MECGDISMSFHLPPPLHPLLKLPSVLVRTPRHRAHFLLDSEVSPHFLSLKFPAIYTLPPGSCSLLGLTCLLCTKPLKAGKSFICVADAVMLHQIPLDRFHVPSPVCFFFYDLPLWLCLWRMSCVTGVSSPKSLERQNRLGLTCSGLLLANNWLVQECERLASLPQVETNSEVCDLHSRVPRGIRTNRLSMRICQKSKLGLASHSPHPASPWLVLPGKISLTNHLPADPPQVCFWGAPHPQHTVSPS